MTDFRQTASPLPNASGMVAIHKGSEMELAVWAYSVESVELNPKAPGIQIGLKSGSWFAADVSVGEFMTALGAATQMYVKEERMLRSVKAVA